MEEKFSILIVEDEEAMALGLKDFFLFSNFNVHLATDCKSALELFSSKNISIIILDLMLPDCDGLDLCKKLKAIRPGIPIIILTAKGREIDVIRGFEAGADDYVKKPFSLNELLARVKASLRKIEEKALKSSTFKFSGFFFDSKRGILKKGEKTFFLTFLEAELLKYFLQNSNRIISREELLREIWKVLPSPGNRYIDNYILKLRKKIESNPKNPEHILTVYGQGYKFIP